MSGTDLELLGIGAPITAALIAGTVALALYFGKARQDEKNERRKLKVAECDKRIATLVEMAVVLDQWSTRWQDADFAANVSEDSEEITWVYDLFGAEVYESLMTLEGKIKRLGDGYGPHPRPKAADHPRIFDPKWRFSETLGELLDVLFRDVGHEIVSKRYGLGRTIAITSDVERAVRRLLLWEFRRKEAIIHGEQEPAAPPESELKLEVVAYRATCWDDVADQALPTPEDIERRQMIAEMEALRSREWEAENVQRRPN